MMLIVAYWLLLFLLFLPGGFLLNRIFRLNVSNIPLLVLLGMFLTSVLFTCTAFFLPLNGIIFCAFSVLALLLWITYYKPLAKNLQAYYKQFASLPIYIKFSTVAILLLSGIKSAQVPTIIDNETYYIQTIKWINEYGFVKGLGNLHPFLAQMSPWHVLQAGLNLNFITDNLNDSNGFLLVIFCLFCFTETTNHSKNIHWILLLPAFYGVAFIFVDAPSPDLPLLLITPLIFYLLIRQHTVLPWLLFLFLVFIKITIAPLGLLFLYPLFRTRKDSVTILLTGFVIGGLWMIKNYVISGYPLYPFTLWETNADWQVPKHLLQGLHESSNRYIYGCDNSSGLLTKFKSWLTLSGIKGVMNNMIVILFCMLPFFRKIRSNKLYKMIYLACVVQFILLFFISPQYRFYLPVVLFFSSFITSEIITILNIKKVYPNLLLTGIAVSALLCIKGFSIMQLYTPAKNTMYPEMQYISKKEGNLNYFSPQQSSIIYQTSDGSLPCVNEKQIQWFKKKYRVVPQLRGNTLSNGFYSKTIEKE